MDKDFQIALNLLRRAFGFINYEGMEMDEAEAVNHEVYELLKRYGYFSKQN